MQGLIQQMLLTYILCNSDDAFMGLSHETKVAIF